jgi:hypothetical protein
MTRNLLYLVIVALVALSAGLGYALYQERQDTSRLEIRLGPKGIAVEKK